MNREVWNWLNDERRMDLVTRCGWVNRNGAMTPTGRRIYRSAWDHLSSAAQNVLTTKWGK